MKEAGRWSVTLMEWRKAGNQPLAPLHLHFPGPHFPGPSQLTGGIRPITRFVKETHIRGQLGRVPQETLIGNRGLHQRSYQRKAELERNRWQLLTQQQVCSWNPMTWYPGTPQLTVRLCGEPDTSPTAVTEAKTKSMFYTVNSTTSCYLLLVWPRKCKVEINELRDLVAKVMVRHFIHSTNVYITRHWVKCFSKQKIN